jgi:hypothetical protein
MLISVLGDVTKKGDAYKYSRHMSAAK